MDTPNIKLVDGPPDGHLIYDLLDGDYENDGELRGEAVRVGVINDRLFISLGLGDDEGVTSATVDLGADAARALIATLTASVEYLDERTVA